MKLSNRKILDFINSDLVSKKLPIKLAYAISVNVSAVEGAIKAFNNQRTNLIEKYAKKGEDGKPISDNGNYIIENTKEWNESINELLDAESDVNVTTITLDLLEKCDDEAFDKLSVGELAVISFMVSDNKD